MALVTEDALSEEIEFVTADGLAQVDALFEEEFGDFSEERIKIVGGSDSIGTSGFCNDCTC